MVHLMCICPAPWPNMRAILPISPKTAPKAGTRFRGALPTGRVLHVSEFLARRSNLVHVAGGWAHFPVPGNFHMNIFRLSRRPNRTFLRFWWLGHRRRRKRPQNKKAPFVLDPLSLSLFSSLHVESIRVVQIYGTGWVRIGGMSHANKECLVVQGWSQTVPAVRDVAVLQKLTIANFSKSILFGGSNRHRSQ